MRDHNGRMSALASLVPEQARRPAAAAVLRRLDASSLEALEPFQGSGALDAGQVCMINLEALVQAFGARWQGRREQVYEHVERVLERTAGPTAYVARVTETDYLIAQPDLGPFGAQATCLRSLKEVLSHFLGAVQPRQLSVCRVTGIANGELRAEPIDPRAAMEGEARERQAAHLDAESNDPTLLNPERWSPFVAGNGREVRVSCKLEPVFELKGNMRIGYRLARKVIYTSSGEELAPHEIYNLTRADLIRIDMATIARGMDRLASESGEGAALSLTIPVSYVSLSSVDGRKLLTSAFQAARKQVLKGVICEVCDIENVPQAPLLSAVSFIKPASLFVIGHLTGLAPHVSPNLRETGLQALSFTVPSMLAGDAEFLGWTREVIKSARRVSKTVMIYGCPNPRRLAMAGLMEATHASLAA